MKYPDHVTYARVYARYLTGKRTSQLLDAAGPLADKDVLDLCAGGGRLSLMAQERGARVTAVDSSPDMAEGLPPGVRSFIQDVPDWLQLSGSPDMFDAVFCQQAVNYWLTPTLAETLSHVIRPGGLFVFNTFNRKPSPVPTIKQYALEGVQFVESSWLSAGNQVEHVHMREGEPPHTTRFSWISPEQYSEWLSPYFEAKEHQEGATSLWVCRLNRKTPL